MRATAAGLSTALLLAGPAGCTAGSHYPDGDPLDTASDVLIFANRHEASG